jgi:hypothetical protein
MDFFGIVTLGQKELTIILLLFFIFLYISRLILLKEIFEIFQKEYTFFFSKFNTEGRSFFNFLSSGKSMFFATKLIFNSEYNLDENIAKKRYSYIFYTFFYYITFFMMAYMVYSIYFLV